MRLQAGSILVREPRSVTACGIRSSRASQCHPTEIRPPQTPGHTQRRNTHNGKWLRFHWTSENQRRVCDLFGAQKEALRGERALAMRSQVNGMATQSCDYRTGSPYRFRRFCDRVRNIASFEGTRWTLHLQCPCHSQCRQGNGAVPIERGVTQHSLGCVVFLRWRGFVDLTQGNWQSRL